MDEQKELDKLIGKTIKSIHRNPINTDDITIIFTDLTSIVIDVEGDDMTHIVFDIYKTEVK